MGIYALPLSYGNIYLLFLHSFILFRMNVTGKDRIRTYAVITPTDLQSVTFDLSVTSPMKKNENNTKNGNYAKNIILCILYYVCYIC